ncbi:hypothetical protein ACH9DO_03055 [Kocuria sp. M1N1S27]
MVAELGHAEHLAQDSEQREEVVAAGVASGGGDLEIRLAAETAIFRSLHDGRCSRQRLTP